MNVMNAKVSKPLDKVNTLSADRHTADVSAQEVIKGLDVGFYQDTRKPRHSDASLSLSSTLIRASIDSTKITALSVVDHYENPRNVGSLDKNAKNVGTGLVGAPACGDVMKLQIQVDEKGKIVDARFKTFGCGSAIASSSLATEWIKGKTVDEALKIKNTEIAKELSLPPVKLHCSMLAEDAIKAALADYRLKQDNEKAVETSS
ncbi:ISCU enzyme, partial [Polypterus senegalus]